MNTLKQILSSFCLLFSLSLSAQKNDSALELPYTNKIEVSHEVLESLFQANTHIAVEISPEFKLVGDIQDKSLHNNAVVSLLIKLEGSPKGTLSISRYRDPNGHFQYTGHILKLHEVEGLVLKEKDQHYYFIETQQKFLVSE